MLQSPFDVSEGFRESGKGAVAKVKPLFVCEGRNPSDFLRWFSVGRKVRVLKYLGWWKRRSLLTCFRTGVPPP